MTHATHIAPTTHTSSPRGVKMVRTSPLSLTLTGSLHTSTLFLHLHTQKNKCQCSPLDTRRASIHTLRLRRRTLPSTPPPPIDEWLPPPAPPVWEFPPYYPPSPPRPPPPPPPPPSPPLIPYYKEDGFFEIRFGGGVNTSWSEMPIAAEIHTHRLAPVVALGALGGGGAALAIAMLPVIRRRRQDRNAARGVPSGDGQMSK